MPCLRFFTGLGTPSRAIFSCTLILARYGCVATRRQRIVRNAWQKVEKCHNPSEIQIDMETVDRKDKFVELLRSHFHVGGEERLFIQDAVLRENGLGDRTFWETTCPLLQKDGMLKSYNDPDGIAFAFKQFCLTSPVYKSKYDQRWNLLRTDDDRYVIGATTPEVEKLDAEMREIEGNLRQSFRHLFVVDAKLLSGGNKDGKTKIYFDDKKGIYIDAKRKYEIAKKRLRCVQRLIEAESLTSEDLLELWGNKQLISKEIRDINKTFRERLAIEIDLILHSATSGYYVNRDDFEIVSGTGR